MHVIFYESTDIILLMQIYTAHPNNWLPKENHQWLSLASSLGILWASLIFYGSTCLIIYGTPSMANRDITHRWLPEKIFDTTIDNFWLGTVLREWVEPPQGAPPTDCLTRREIFNFFRVILLLKVLYYLPFGLFLLEYTQPWRSQPSLSQDSFPLQPPRNSPH